MCIRDRAQRDVRLRLAESRRMLEGFDARSMHSIRLLASGARTQLGPLAAHLVQLSPLKILERGYAIVERDGNIVKSPADAPARSSIRVRLAKGGLEARVTRATPPVPQTD